MCLFGFMDLLIVIKWLTDWNAEVGGTQEVAPGVITSMIVMFIYQGKKPADSKEADIVPDQ